MVGRGFATVRGRTWGARRHSRSRAVKFPFLRRKDVNYDVAEVHQHPARCRGAFPAVARDAGFFQGVGQILLQGLDLAGRFGRHYDEIVGERGQPPQIQQHDVLGQLVRGHVYD